MRVGSTVVAGIVVLSGAPAAHAEDTVTVMSRNLYLGADVAVALELIPDMPAAAQFMWQQVAATDFTARAKVLAQELVDHRPDVVALQEATTWQCRTSVLGEDTVVFDFTAQLLGAAAEAGAEYVVAAADGEVALNPGYTIPALPFLTTVRDPDTFQPLFGSDEAACGFTIADALLVRADLAPNVTAVGNVDYGTSEAIVPVVFEIDRGFTWADVEVGGGPVRFVATHLESLWTPGAVPKSALQAQELVEALADHSGPLVIVGDFNADPRDPRPAGAPNPGLQPDITTGCAAQVSPVTASTADASCNAYWRMVEAGFVDVGPDSLDARNATWGASALLAGPDLGRLNDAGVNPYGFTDRLDYVFVRGDVEVDNVSLVGATWPDSDELWACADPEQQTNARQAAAAMGKPLGAAVCLPTDHVGLLATLTVTGAAASSPTESADEASDGAGWRTGVAVAALVALVLAVWFVVSRRRLS